MCFEHSEVGSIRYPDDLLELPRQEQLQRRDHREWQNKVGNSKNQLRPSQLHLLTRRLFLLYNKSEKQLSV